MRDVVILLVLISTIPMTFLRPHVGILAWCWVSYMNPHRLSWSFAYEFPVAMVVGLATLIAWMLSREPKKLQINAVSGLLLAFFVWMSFANLFAMVPDLAFEKWDRCFKILLMTFVTMALITSRERLHALIWIIVLSLAFFGIKGGIFTILQGGEAHVWGPPGSFIADNNALAMALIMVLPLLRYLQMHTESRLTRMGLYGSMVLMVFSIIGSQSRGAFVGAIAMLIFLLLKSRQRLVVGVLAVGLVAVSAAFVPQVWIDRMKTIETYKQDGSALHRLEVWEFAIKVVRDRPIVGGGFRVSYDDNIYLSYIPDARGGHGKNFHSVYFEVLGELGFVGLFLYLALMLAAWRSGSRVIALTRDRPDLSWANDLARMVQVCLVGFATAGAFQNLAFFDLYFHLVAILFATQLIVGKALQERSMAQTSEAMILQKRINQVSRSPIPGSR
jgi:probable O-glycosylation ligase (exosortase A-associated)